MDWSLLISKANGDNISELVRLIKHKCEPEFYTKRQVDAHNYPKYSKIIEGADIFTNEARLKSYFAKLVCLDCGCIVSNGKTSSSGYGVISLGKRRLLGHVFMFRMFIGKIPEYMVLDHLCRNRACVNPFHLEPVTNKENILRGNGATAFNARKTHCSMGHEFTQDNIVKTRHGKRCRICRDANNASRYPHLAHNIAKISAARKQVLSESKTNRNDLSKKAK